MNAKKCKEIRKVAKVTAKCYGWPLRNLVSGKKVIFKDKKTGKEFTRTILKNDPKTFRGEYRRLKNAVN